MVLTFSSAYAKKIFPAEIMGRDLNISGLGWIGYVGISNAVMFDPSGMTQTTSLLIEVLNETPVGQINTISDFISCSPFWGSRYGPADLMRNFK